MKPVRGICKRAALLLAVFALHNAEEVASLKSGRQMVPAAVQRLGLDPDLYEPKRMAIATAALTLGCGAALVPVCTAGSTISSDCQAKPGGRKDAYLQAVPIGEGTGQSSRRPSKRRSWLAAVVSAGLGFNALTHMGRAIVAGKYNGGLASAPVLFGAAAAMIHKLLRDTELDSRDVVSATACSLVLSPLLIGGALSLAAGLTRNQTRPVRETVQP